MHHKGNFFITKRDSLKNPS